MMMLYQYRIYLVPGPGPGRFTSNRYQPVPDISIAHDTKQDVNTATWRRTADVTLASTTAEGVNPGRKPVFVTIDLSQRGSQYL